MIAASTAPSVGLSRAVGAAAAPKSHGVRLLAALEAVDALPANAGVRSRFLESARTDDSSSGALAAIAGHDPALAARLVRLANRAANSPRSGVVSAAQAIEVLGRDRARAAIARLPHYALPETLDAWHDEVDRFRIHAVAVRRVATTLATDLGDANPERVEMAALLHDVGKLVLARVHQDYPDWLLRSGGPEERVAAEHKALSVDHAAVGGLVARRWRLPRALSAGIEKHHAPDAGGTAAIVRLADMLVHRCNGVRVPLRDLAAAATQAGFPDQTLGRMLDQPAVAIDAAAPREPCPLTRRQLEMVRGLSQGQHYKEIAHGLDLSLSTVRTHVHQAYKRLGVRDRAQAVLLAADRGWLDATDLPALAR